MRLKQKLALRVATVSVVVLGTISLMGCSSQNGNADAPAAASADGAPETADLTLGVTPVGDFAPIYYAASEGLFEDYGLHVTIEAKGGAEVPALLSNSYQIMSMSLTTIIQAAAQGVPISLIAPGISLEPDTQTGVYAMPDSGIAKLTDLEGRSLAINQPMATFEINSRIALEEAGIDADDVVFQTLPLSTIVDSLDAGQVDAAYLVPPYSTQAEAAGATLIFDINDSEILKGTPVSGYGATAEFAKNNPNTIAAFQAAMAEASEILSADPDLYHEYLSTYTQLTPELAAAVPAYSFPTTIDVDKLQQLADIMQEHDFSTGAVDVASITVQPASS